jgi:hypothetical protein
LWNQRDRAMAEDSGWLGRSYKALETEEKKTAVLNGAFRLQKHDSKARSGTRRQGVTPGAGWYLRASRLGELHILARNVVPGIPHLNLRRTSRVHTPKPEPFIPLSRPFPNPSFLFPLSSRHQPWKAHHLQPRPRPPPYPRMNTELFECYR